MPTEVIIAGLAILVYRRLTVRALSTRGGVAEREVTW